MVKEKFECQENRHWGNNYAKETKMKIYVDADACPVKDIMIPKATRAEIPVILG